MKSIIVFLILFNGFNFETAELIQKQVVSTYGVTCMVINGHDLPERFSVKKMNRIVADSIVSHMDKMNDGKSIYVGLLDDDICTRARGYQYWGIFGYSYKSGCVISSYRMKDSDSKLTLIRLMKVTIHEIGHSFGLGHCLTPSCIMNDAEKKISTVDKEEMSICPKCKRVLQIILE